VAGRPGRVHGCSTLIARAIRQGDEGPATVTQDRQDRQGRLVSALGSLNRRISQADSAGSIPSPAPRVQVQVRGEVPGLGLRCSQAWLIFRAINPSGEHAC
jgi:hypothetical protein